jgi:hypothetical protein
VKACLLALFFALPAFADTGITTPAAGTYAFQGDFTVAMKIRFKLVYAFTETGAEELKQREAAGEECWHKGSDIYQCKEFSKLGSAVDEVRSRVETLIGGQTLVLGDAQGEPSEISKGESGAEFSVNQSASFNGVTYDHYRLVSVSGAWSIRLGELTEAQFNIGADGELALTRVVPVTKSREEFSNYLVDAPFRRM